MMSLLIKEFSVFLLSQKMSPRLQFNAIIGEKIP